MTNDSDDAFEPELEGFPTEIDPRHVRSRERVEVLASDFAAKSRQGLNPSIDEYIDRHPDLKEQILELFPMVAALEQWKSDRESELLRQQLPDDFSIEQLGDCRIVREIGRGGMGVVFEALQGSLEQQVAVKLLPWRISLVPQRQERFEREAQTIAKLRHSNIVPIFSFGRHEDYAYYVMQYVENASLSVIISRLRDEGSVLFEAEVHGERETSEAPWAATTSATHRGLRSDSWRQFAKIGIQVAQALRHAHRQGVLHNDVKPGNLLVDASGRIWVTDFGLAEELNASNPVEDDRVTGTLRYMAPERFEGRSDETSDVYSLGITMLELATQATAFEAESRTSLLEQITVGKLRRPSEIVSDIPSDFEAIILKATAFSADQRYQSAGEMASDLLRFVNGEKTRARSEQGLFSRLRRRR